jgi:peptidoglycan hydrolase CwlO-like protein
MRNIQQNLLIALALALCGLCAFQWYEQTVQRNAITTLNGIVYEKNVGILDATNSVANLNHQIEQMDASLTKIKAEAARNEQLIVLQKADIARFQFTDANLTNEIVQYKAVVETLSSKLKDAYAGIKEQNTTITNLVSQRDELVRQFNDSVKERNDIVAKYNDLVKQLQKQQNEDAKQ